MKPIEFPEQTAVLAKDQPQYKDLPAHVWSNDDQGKMTFCWKLTWKERLRILVTGVLWQELLTFDFRVQPTRLSVDKPKFKDAPGEDHAVVQ